jgi:hypothetical protein
VAVGPARSVTYRGGVRIVGRRRPSGLWVGGLRCCVAVLVLVGLWLGVGVRHAHLNERLSVSVSHRVVVVTPIARPTPPYDDAVPPELVLIVTGLLGLLIVVRLTVAVARTHPYRPRGRAPPVNLLHV